MNLYPSECDDENPEAMTPKPPSPTKTTEPHWKSFRLSPIQIARKFDEKYVNRSGTTHEAVVFTLLAVQEAFSDLMDDFSRLDSKYGKDWTEWQDVRDGLKTLCNYDPAPSPKPSAERKDIRGSADYLRKVKDITPKPAPPEATSYSHDIGGCCGYVIDWHGNDPVLCFLKPGHEEKEHMGQLILRKVAPEETLGTCDLYGCLHGRDTHNASTSTLCTDWRPGISGYVRVPAPEAVGTKVEFDAFAAIHPDVSRHKVSTKIDENWEEPCHIRKSASADVVGMRGWPKNSPMVAPGEAVGRETRDTVIKILKNCAADYCHPQTRNPENPQWRIDCAIANGVKILESELSTLRRERDQIIAEVHEARHDELVALRERDQAKSQVRELTAKLEIAEFNRS